MKSRLMRMRPHERTLLVRRLELASDNPLLDPSTRRRAERRLQEAKAILKARAMHLWSPYGCRSETWRVGLNRWRQWRERACDCGVRGSVVWEAEAGVWPLRPVYGADGVTVAGDGSIRCLTCGSRL